MNELITRTPDVIAIEINSIKDQTRTILLCGSIEIGRRLVEAKSLVDHGEWGDWLKNSIDYSQRTAQNLMKIFEEYGSDQIPLFGDNSKAQALADLTYTQAVALLGVPADEREEFVKENDLNSMSTRELQQAIKAQKEAEGRAEKAENERAGMSITWSAACQAQKEAEVKAQRLQSELKNEKQKAKLEIEQLTTLLDEAKNNGSSDEKLSKLETDLKTAQNQVQELTEKINAPITLEPTVVEKVPEEIEQELNQLRKRTKELEEKTGTPVDPAVLKYGVYFEELVNGFKNLLGSLAEIQDTKTQEKYKNAVIGLMGKMSDRLV